MIKDQDQIHQLQLQLADLKQQEKDTKEKVDELIEVNSDNRKLIKGRQSKFEKSNQDKLAQIHKEAETQVKKLQEEIHKKEQTLSQKKSNEKSIQTKLQEAESKINAQIKIYETAE